MNLVLSDKLKQQIKELNSDYLKIVDVILTDNSIMREIHCINDERLRFPSRYEISNSDIINIELHKPKRK